MLATIIICTYNRADFLARLLDSLHKQNISPTHYEIVLVNDASTDHNGTIYQNFYHKFPNIQYHKLPKNIGKSRAIFMGISKAKSDKILFTDDDCVADSKWVQSMIAALETTPLVSGRITTAPKPFLQLCQNISEFHEFMYGNDRKSVDFMAGANMGIKKVVLETIDPVTTDTSFDSNICLQARSKGYSVRFCSSGMMKHVPKNKDIVSLCKYEIKRAINTIQLRNKYRTMLRTPIFLRSSLLLLLLSPLISIGKTASIYLLNPALFKYIHTFPIVIVLKFSWCLGAYKGLKKIGK